MEITDLFQRMKLEWPDMIDISDALVERNSFLFPSLSKAWTEVEHRWENRNDEWMNVGIWAFFQTAHAAAQDELASGKSEISLNMLNAEVFEKYVKTNLKDPSWGDMLNKIQ